MGLTPTFPAITDPLRETVDLIRDTLEVYANHGVAASNSFIDIVEVTGRQAVIDYCCPGFGWVRVGNSYPTDRFPARASNTLECVDGLFAAEIELGLSACSAPIEDPEVGPLPADLDIEAFLAGIFRSILTQTAICGLRDAGIDCENLVVGDVQPLDNYGGCFGFTIDLVIAYQQCCDVIVAGG